jgi:hypothetical protein
LWITVALRTRSDSSLTDGRPGRSPTSIDSTRASASDGSAAAARAIEARAI